MKPVNIQYIRPGMVLARSIFDEYGRILLTDGVSLTEDYITKLKTLLIPTVYIKDPVFDDIEVPEYLTASTQRQAMATIANTFEKIRSGQNFCLDSVYDLSSTIIEELLAQGDIPIYLTGLITHDGHTFAHSLNCAIYTAILANLSGFSASKIKEITCGALLHDIGKLSINPAILNKPGKLDAQEWENMQQHTDNGFAVLRKKRWDLSILVAHMAWQHHEHYDGNGYPRGLSGADILPYARLLAIADVYEALTAERPYAPAMLPHEAHQIIHNGLNRHFDPEYGRRFLAKVVTFTPGMEVRLNTDEIAIVISVTAAAPQRPLVRVIAYPDGSPCHPPREINLAEQPDLHIITGRFPQ